ncbi:MAG TPA: RNA methyltransferase [Firmicutes bacterium]|nr:RNA methyltransferase [Bacillota bacterium]
MRGYFGIGIEHTKTAPNMGTLYRSALAFGASFIFTVERRYNRDKTDTVAASRHIPLYHYESLDDLLGHLPHDCKLVGIELDERAVSLNAFSHPERCCYILGAEDLGLSEEARQACSVLVQISGRYCLNVAVAGSIVMYDRLTKAVPAACPQCLAPLAR